MNLPTLSHLTKPERRRAMRLAYANGGLWSIGNGMVGTSLISYLAQELGAAGLAVGFILAAPRLIGVFRMLTPHLMAWVGHRQKFCLLMYAASNFVLLALPMLAAPGFLLKKHWALVALIVCWSVYHLLEYCATVALTSWLGDICLQRIRGEFFGRRERWLSLGRIVGMIAAGGFTFWWLQGDQRHLNWLGYAFTSAAGAMMMLGSLWPLWLMPNLPVRKDATSADAGGEMHKRSTVSTFQSNWRRLTDPRFQRLLFFGCIFSLANGITQAAQGVFPYKLLHLELFVVLTLEAITRLGQGMFAPSIGKLIDRFGNRPVMIVCQTIVALGLLFYLPATADQPWWIVGAWVCFIAYAGINIALSSLTIKLAGKEDASLYLATWFGVTGVVYGVSTVMGGLLFDELQTWERSAKLPWGGTLQIDRYQLLFYMGMLGRLLAAIYLTQLIEPGASSVREFLIRKRTKSQPDAEETTDETADSA